MVEKRAGSSKEAVDASWEHVGLLYLASLAKMVTVVLESTVLIDRFALDTQRLLPNKVPMDRKRYR